MGKRKENGEERRKWSQSKSYDFFPIFLSFFSSSFLFVCLLLISLFFYEILYLFICSFIYSCICLFIHSFVLFPILSFICSFIYLSLFPRCYCFSFKNHSSLPLSLCSISLSLPPSISPPLPPSFRLIFHTNNKSCKIEIKPNHG